MASRVHALFQTRTVSASPRTTQPTRRTRPAFNDQTGRSFRLGDMTATVIRDDGQTCHYRIGAFGRVHVASHERIAVYTRHNQRTPKAHECHPETVRNGKKMTSTAPSGKRWL